MTTFLAFALLLAPPSFADVISDGGQADGGGGDGGGGSEDGGGDDEKDEDGCKSSKAASGASLGLGLLLLAGSQRRRR